MASESPEGQITLLEAYRLQIHRVVLTIGIVFSVVAFVYLGKWIRIPEYPGFSISLMEQASPIIAVPFVAVMAIVCAIVCTGFTRYIRDEAGVYCAAIGLIALSARGGTIVPILQQSPAQSTYLLLALECAILLAIVVAQFLVVGKVFGANSGGLAGALSITRIKDDSRAYGLSLLTNFAITAALCFLIAASPSKVQCIAAVGVGSLVATWCATSIAPQVPAAMHALIPPIIGTIGFLVAFFVPGTSAIGQTGFPIANILPIDFASAGVAGSILGHWWATHVNEESENVESEQ